MAVRLRYIPAVPLAVMLGACEKEGPLEQPVEDDAIMPTDTIALTVGDYHGVYAWYHWDMGSGSSSGSYDLDFSVVVDSTWSGRINVHDEQHVLINSDLSLSFGTGGMVTGRVVLGDSIFVTRSQFAPGFQNSHSFKGKKIH
jgi:hypothetical protein